MALTRNPGTVLPAQVRILRDCLLGGQSFAAGDILDTAGHKPAAIINLLAYGRAVPVSDLPPTQSSDDASTASMDGAPALEGGRETAAEDDAPPPRTRPKRRP